jgi:hypothetical protein
MSTAGQPKPFCLNVEAWRASTSAEVVDFLDMDKRDRPKRHTLVVRSGLKPADVYGYLKARFGEPNGFQNFLRKDDSDNLIHWDFNLKAGNVDVYFCGASREVHIIVSEELTDEQWKALIRAIRSDYSRVAASKSTVMKSFEKFVSFPNKFAALANLCAELHAQILDAPPKEQIPQLPDSKDDLEDYKTALDHLSKRATELYGNCLKLRLLTPIMAEAYINMTILMFCKDNLRNDTEKYQAFLRSNVPTRLALMSKNCDGFARTVDSRTDAYATFMRVINKRNFALHGNVDPINEKIEVIYFDGKRPLFASPGHHIVNFIENLERLARPQEVITEYQEVHTFLLEIADCLSPPHRTYFDQVIGDSYPGYELKKKRVTRILPDHVAMSLLPGMKYDDQLDTTGNATPRVARACSVSTPSSRPTFQAFLPRHPLECVI